MTLNYWRICVANLLFFAAVYTLLPVLPLALSGEAGIDLGEMSKLYLAFLAGTWAVGPIHAYLGDTYKRKEVLVLSTLALAATMAGYAYLYRYHHLLVVAVLQGAAFALSATAGITLAIDITNTTRRSDGNMVFAWMSRVGMLVGIAVGLLGFNYMGFRPTIYVAVALALLAMLIQMRIHVTFRAPIGLSLFSIDRFILPRAWLPAINLAIAAFVPGVLMPLLTTDSLWPVLALIILAVTIVPVVKCFVRMSNHCQRGTANGMCLLAVECGLVVGMAAACLLIADHAHNYAEVLRQYALGATVIALALLLVATRPYYLKKKVR